MHKASAGAARRFALLVEAQQEAADRVGRVLAIADKLVPIRVAMLRRVLAKGKEHEARLFRARGKAFTRLRKRERGGLAGAAVRERGLERIEAAQLLLGCQPRGVGDIVGLADEAVEREDRTPQLRREQKGGDREILVPVRFRRPHGRCAFGRYAGRRVRDQGSHPNPAA